MTDMIDYWQFRWGDVRGFRSSGGACAELTYEFERTLILDAVDNCGNELPLQEWTISVDRFGHPLEYTGLTDAEDRLYSEVTWPDVREILRLGADDGEE